jgi:hypothetical protein
VEWEGEGGFKFLQMKGYTLLNTKEDNSISKYTLIIFKNLLQNQVANFNQMWYKSFLHEGNLSFFK